MNTVSVLTFLDTQFCCALRKSALRQISRKSLPNISPPYNGIEPAPEGGLLGVNVERHGEELIIIITNPTAGQSQHAVGNHMALANIRERLALYYDLEARLDILAGADRYEVRITLPCQALRP